MDEWDEDDTHTLLGRESMSSTKSARTGMDGKMVLVADALERTGMGRYQWSMSVRAYPPRRR